jgi:hypothetical protein
VPHDERFAPPSHYREAACGAGEVVVEPDWGWRAWALSGRHERKVQSHRWRGQTDIRGFDLNTRYFDRYRFTHCPDVVAASTVGPDVWRRSWDDVFTDYEAWELAGAPDGYVWGVWWADAYPGMSYG